MRRIVKICLRGTPMANFDMEPLDVRDDWYQSYTHQVEHSWFLVFRTRHQVEHSCWVKSSDAGAEKYPGAVSGYFCLFYIFSVLFLAETLCFIFQVLYLILSQAKFQLSLLIKYSILNIFMSPLLSLGSKGHITLKWSGRTLKSLSQVKYSIFNILSLWSKGHITLKWSSHTQVSQLQFTSESECFWELPPP